MSGYLLFTKNPSIFCPHTEKTWPYGLKGEVYKYRVDGRYIGIRCNRGGYKGQWKYPSPDRYKILSFEEAINYLNGDKNESEIS